MRRLLPVFDASPVDRRQALLTLGVGASLAACGGGGSPTDTGTDAGQLDDTSNPADVADAGANCTDLPVMLGTIDMFPVNTWSIIVVNGNLAIVVGHDANGLYAYSAVCTHQRCLVCLTSDTSNSCPVSGFQASAGDTICYCHGSQYDADGNVTQGPATVPLANYLVTVCNGVVSCATTHRVPIGTRLAV